MSQIFDDQGNAIPVTVIEAGPCPVILKRTSDKDGYQAVQLAFGEIRESLLTKPVKGQFTKRGQKPARYLQEIRTDNLDFYNEQVKVDIFEVGQRVDVIGTSKGKGYAGAMKRHNFRGTARTHGTKKVHRAPCSTGSVDSARTFKGIKKPGQLGNHRVTALNVQVVRVDPERNLLLLRGSVPGAMGRLVTIRESVKK